MLEQINLEIAAHLENYISPDSLDAKINQTKTLLTKARDELGKLEYTMKKEQLDVEKMSQLSLKTLFYKCLGTHDKVLGKEKEEALAAVLKYESCQKTVDELTEKLNQLTTRHYEMTKIQDKLEHLYQEKRKVMAAFQTPEYARIEQLEKEMYVIKSEIKEIKEAIVPGNRAIDALNEAIGYLDSAGDWGTWDIIGGGVMTDMMKHNKMDQAKQAVLNAQTHIQMLQVELQDVNTSLENSITITGGEVFMDFFFDGLIADWYMQSKIRTSRDNVITVCNEIRSIIGRLSSQLAFKEKALEDKQQEIERIIRQV